LPGIYALLPWSHDDRRAHPPKGLPGIYAYMHGSLEKARFE
jgi:hypothetical protein